MHATQKGCLARQAPCLPSRCVVAAAAKKQKPKKRQRKGKQPVSQRITYTEDLEDDDYDVSPDVVLMPTKVPKAPPPVSTPRGAPVQPQDLYPVFPQQPSAVEKLPDSKKGSWADRTAAAASTSGGAAQQEQPAPLWNPKTGFMRTRADVEQANAAVDANALPASSSSSSKPGPAAAGAANSSSSSRLVEALPAASDPLQPPSLPPAAAVDAAGQLPAVSREAVLGGCAATSAAMVVAAVGLRFVAQHQSAALYGRSQEAIDQLLQLPAGLQDVQQAGIMLAAAGFVTGMRLLLLQQWREFQEATERSNTQVLGPLGLPDAALIAVLTGFSEELLFRGALIPASWPDARGVLLSGAMFGILHVTGGRNAAFAAWATVVGWLYGAAFVATSNIWVPAGAHAIANFASAAVWMNKRRGPQHQ